MGLNNDTEPFGFVDPACATRAVHLIPAFEHGRTAELLGPSIGFCIMSTGMKNKLIISY